VAVLLDGKKTAEAVREEVRARVVRLAERGVVPGLAVVQAGSDPASSVYVRMKRRTCEALGIRSFAHDLPGETSQDELTDLVSALAANPDVHGILVQLPLPAHVDAQAILARIPPDKDVDGFHPINVGNLALGKPCFAPCTPAGVMVMLERYGVPVAGKRAIVLGRSAIVGKPMALLLLAADATVTIAHSKSRDLPALCREADIVIAAVGRPELVRGEWIREGAAVVDVGVHRIGEGKLTGDVAFAEVEPRAGWISPVPGGVGPMTIAMLMDNTVRSAELRHGFAGGTP
jgi:methylenetetrahydrofolate dehydrogenase (NADP+)/methenyltetrahydrofolate cyclohydrolase